MLADIIFNCFLPLFAIIICEKINVVCHYNNAVLHYSFKNNPFHESNITFNHLVL